MNESAGAKKDSDDEERKPSLPAVHFFNLVQEGINDKPTCTHETIDYATGIARKTELKNLHIDGEHKLDTKLESELYMCITEQLCGAVSIEIKPIADDKDGNKQFDSIVCHHYYQAA